MSRRTVLILGGGYGGLACLRGLRRRLPPERYEIRLVDATPHHQIKTRFHERAVYEDRDTLIRLPLPPIVEGAGAEFVLGRALEIDFTGKRVVTPDGEHSYDLLVLALGGQIAHFGVPGAGEHTVSLQSYEEAVECARRVRALELRTPRSPRRRVVVVGAGIEGVEVAAMLRQYAPRQTCDILLMERGDTVIARSQCSDTQRRHVLRHFERRGVAVRFGATIRQVGESGVLLESGEEVPADLVIWCSGVRRAEIGGVPPSTPFTVSRCLQSPHHPEVFAIGDFATVDSGEAYANLASAQRAVDLAGPVADNLWRYENHRPLRPARYRPIGELVALGDFDGVGIVRGIPVYGTAAGLLKKANEWKYLAEIHRDLPGSFLRGLGAGGGGEST